MGGPISPVVDNFYMEIFEQQALRTARTGEHYFRYVDNTFVIRSHGKTQVEKLLLHLSSQP